MSTYFDIPLPLRIRHLAGNKIKTLTVTALLFAILTIVPSFVSADAPVEGRIGRAEVRYMEGVIDHQQMAIDMALDCLARTDGSDSLTETCQAVVDAQQPEIEQMQA